MRKVRGFSLLELIGVMAVMAILAGALAPSVFQLIEEGYQTAERQSLETIAQALERSVRQTKSIPTETAWADAVAAYASIAPQRVLTNEKRFQRRLFVDPKFFTSKNKKFPGYTQGQGLAAPPQSPRMMLVSNLDGPIKQSLKTHKQFSAVWEQTSKAPLKESKALFVQRINLAPAFVRVVLNNQHTDQAGFALEGGSEGAIAGSGAAGGGSGKGKGKGKPKGKAGGGADGSRTVYVIVDSRMDLNAAPYPGGATLRQMIVRNDLSVRYQEQAGGWHWVTE